MSFFWIKAWDETALWQWSGTATVDVDIQFVIKAAWLKERPGSKELILTLKLTSQPDKALEGIRDRALHIHASHIAQTELT